MKPRNRKSFSLIELLVVIGIIAILSSLLFPTLNKARSKGVAIACSGNLKNLYCSTQMYSTDYGDKIMVYESQRGFTWLWYMDNYDNNIRPILYCPAMYRMTEAEKFDSNPQNWMWRGYGIIAPLLLGSPNYYSAMKAAQGDYAEKQIFGGGEWHTLDTRRMKLPADIPLHADTDILVNGTQQYRGKWYYEPRYTDGNFAASANHQRSCNLGYADGHVSSLTAGQLRATGFTRYIDSGSMRYH